MLGVGDIEKVRAAIVLGPDLDGRVAGEGARACDPFYRAWLRSIRGKLAERVAGGAGGGVDLAVPRGWVTSGEWGDTTSADLAMLDFDHALLAMLGREAAAALSDGRAYAEAEAVLHLLDQCARVHEGFEELLMDLHRDPDRETHVDAHRSIQAQREQVMACHARGEIAATRALQAALGHWAHEHARGPDRALELLLRAVSEAR